VVGGSGVAGTVTVTITVMVGVGPGIVEATLTAEAGTCTMMTCGATVVTVVTGMVSGTVVVLKRVVSTAASVVATFASLVAMISDLDLVERPFVEMMAAAIVAQPMMIAPMIGASFVRW
jgi:phage-related protein